MTLPLPLSLLLRLTSVGVLGSLAFYGFSESSHWVLMVSLAFLATLAVMRRVNVLLYWPIGLLTVMVAMYMAYWWQWLNNPIGIDPNSAETLFAILIVLFTIAAALRAVMQREVLVVPSPPRVLSIVLMVALPLALVYLVTVRWGDEPVRLISAHLAGGDHGAHNEIVHRLLQSSEEVTYASPLQMYTYPQAIHFMTANLVAFTQPTSTLPLLAQEYAMGAWVEWVQFAAFSQLAIVVFMKGVRGNGLRRTLFLPPLIFVFASMDSFVMHLLWSGFTTSLGITWILLAFVAISDRLSFKKSLGDLWLMFLVCGFFAYASWIVYQPYSVIFVALAGLIFVQRLTLSQRIGTIMAPLSTALERPVVLVLAVAGAIFTILIGGLGRESPAVTSLLLDGATYKPYFYTVMLWAFAAMAGHWLLTRAGEIPGLDLAQLKFLFVHFGFVTGMVLTVMWAGDVGVLEQPYYTQKMLWVLLFVSLPVALSVGFTWIENLQVKWPVGQQIGFAAVLLTAIVFTPLVQGRYPASATKKHNVDWFAKGMLVEIPDNDYRAVAFSWEDQLGSHLSNLALRATSNLIMPVEVALSDNTFLACRFINENDATVVYSSKHGRSALVESGCKATLLYVENDQIIKIDNSIFPELGVNQVKQMSLGADGVKHLVTGFLDPEVWGSWADGYRSAVIFRASDAAANGQLRMNLATHPVNGRGIGLTIRVNGEVERVISMPQSGEIQIDVELGTVRRRDQFEVTIECARTDEQVLQDESFENPSVCVGVSSIELRQAES